MIGWKRAARIPARRSRRKPVSLHLERLEDRVLLDASWSGQAASILLGDLAHLRNDLATSALTLVNAVQSSPTNPPALAAVANKAWRVLTTDWEQTQRAWVQFEFAVLGAYQQAILTELAGMGIGMPGQAQSPAPAAATPSDANPTLGSTSQAPGSGATGSGSQIQPRVIPLSPTHLPLDPGVYVADDSNLCNCGCTNEAGSLKQNGPSASVRDVWRYHFPYPRGILASPESTTNPVRYADGGAPRRRRGRLQERPRCHAA